MEYLLTWLKRLILITSFLALIITNILTLTSSAFNAAISGLASTALGLRTVYSAFQTKIASQEVSLQKHRATTLKRKAATRKFGTRLASRTKKVAVKSIAAIPAEAIPFIGVAVLIADTSYELYAACQNLRDLDQLYLELEMSEEIPDDAVHAACNPALPDPKAVWAGVAEKSGQWWQYLSKPAE